MTARVTDDALRFASRLTRSDGSRGRPGRIVISTTVGSEFGPVHPQPAMPPHSRPVLFDLRNPAIPEDLPHCPSSELPVASEVDEGRRGEAVGSRGPVGPLALLAGALPARRLGRGGDRGGVAG